MAESSLSYTFKDLYQDVLSYMGQGRDSSDTDALAKAKRRVNDAYRNFLALDWEFLSKVATISIVAGTYEYDLPDDYATTRVSFKLSPDISYKNPTEVPLASIFQLRSFSTATGTPCVFSYISSYSALAGVRYSVRFFPTPDMALTYNYVYKVLTEELSGDTDIPFCPANISHVLRAFCLAEVEAFDEEGAKTTWINKLYQVLLPAAIRENSLRLPNTVGNLNHGADIDTMQHPNFGGLLKYGDYSANI